MALKITLKPHERVIISSAVITNGASRTDLTFENNVPLLRKRDIMCEKDAISLCKRIYFVIQLMYLDEKNLLTHQRVYWKLVKKLLHAIPRMTGFADQINGHILSGRYYHALKLARVLIEFEQEIIVDAH
jgi:flagellar protein FlbT